MNPLYAILIDEAEHIAKAARGSKLLDQLDHLKSLAIMTRVVHVLVGTEPPQLVATLLRVNYHQPVLGSEDLKVLGRYGASSGGM